MYDDLIKQLRYCADATTCRNCLWKTECCPTDMQKKAADAIEELRKAVLRLEDESGIYDELPTVFIYPTEWILATDRVPKEDEVVLTWGKQGAVLLDWRHDNKWCCFSGITHWMPLPEPPKEET